MCRMPDIEETHLPGVGMRHDFITRSGHRIGVVTHRTGRRELLVYDRDDPDACRDVVRLDEEEGHALAEVLGGSHVAEGVSNMLRQAVEGVAIDWLPASVAASCAGHTVAETSLRAETGVSIVAVVRGEDTYPAPSPDFRIEVGDTIVVVGTPQGIQEAFTHLEGGVAG